MVSYTDTDTDTDTDVVVSAATVSQSVSQSSVVRCMTFKPLAGVRDRRALLEEWRRRHGGGKPSTNDSQRDGQSSIPMSGSSMTESESGGVSKANAREGRDDVPRTSTSTSSVGIKYDYAAMGRRTVMKNTNDGVLKVIQPPVSGDEGVGKGEERARETSRTSGEQTSTSTPAKATVSVFSLSSSRRGNGSTNTTPSKLTVDTMPSPAVRARLKIVEGEKAALEELAAKLRASSEAALEAAHSSRTQAEERAKDLTARLQKLDAERSSLESNMATVRAQAQALLTAKDEHARALRKEKRAAEAATKALEQVKRDAANAVQEREFTIEAQGAMLQQLTDDLERAERSREEAELNVEAKDRHLSDLRAQLQQARHDVEAAVKNRSSSMQNNDSGVRASHEKLLQLAAARQEAETESKRARQHARALEIEVEARRRELETVQCELEKCLEEERFERRRAEEAFEEMEVERNTLEKLVEKRTLEKIALEERLEEVTEEADYLRNEMKERDEMLREGNALVEAKETELDEAVSYVLSLQDQLANLQAAGMQGAAVAEEIQEMQRKEKALREEKQKIVDHMQSELTLRDAMLSETKASLKMKEAELNKLRSEYLSKRAELGPLELELDRLHEKINDFKAQLIEKDAKLDANDKMLKQLMSAEKRQSANVARLEFGLAERDEKLRNFNEELNNLKMETEQQEEKVASLALRENELSELKKATEMELSLLREQNAREVKQLKDKAESAVTRAQELEDEVARLRDTSSATTELDISNLRSELDDKQTKWEAAQVEIAQLYTSIAELEYKAEESMSALKAELELTKAELVNARKETDEARANADEVQAESMSLLEGIKETSASMENRLNEYKQLVEARTAQVKDLQREMHDARAKLTEAAQAKESAMKSVTVIQKLESALKFKQAEAERLKGEIVKAQKQLAIFQQELNSSKHMQKELQATVEEMRYRFEKSEQQRDMLAGSLAKQEQYHESANKAREEMHQIALEDAADELKIMKRKSTTLASALQQHVRIHELDAEVALLVDEFAEKIDDSLATQTALPTPTMVLNENSKHKTKPKTYRKTPAKAMAPSKFITPVRADASLKENINKLNERADQISFDDLMDSAGKTVQEMTQAFTTPGNENAVMKTPAMSGKTFAPHSATKRAPLGEVKANVANVNVV